MFAPSGSARERLLANDNGMPKAFAAKPGEDVSLRVEQLLRQMTLAEKVGILTGRSMWSAGGVPRLGVEPLRVSDGPHGMRGFTLHGDAGAMLAPCETAMAATFDEGLVEELGALLGEDCARRGGHTLLGPTMNLQRSPLFGRHFECFSEDPYLTSRCAVAYIKGVQRHAAACAKHFVCNDQEDYRHTMNAVIDERTLREVYLAPFEAAVIEADVESIMTGYNRVNGSYCSESMWLMQTVLREEWKFKGWLVSDWWGNQSTINAITAGLNVEMPGIEPRFYGGHLLEEVRRQNVTEKLIDERCRPVLRTLCRHSGRGVPGAPTEPPDKQAAGRRKEVLRRAASASQVLLKNDGNLLPLNASTGHIAVIGPCAAQPVLQGGGSSRVHMRPCDSILDAIRSFCSKSTVVHEPGCDVGGLSFTHAELEALKPVGACNANGYPLRGYQMTNFFDAVLNVGAKLSGMECVRRYVMPCLAGIGLRKTTPEESARRQAEEAAREKDVEALKRQAYRKSLMAFVGYVGSIVALSAFAAGYSGGSSRLRIAAGAVATLALATPVIRCGRRKAALRAQEMNLRAAEEAAKDAEAVILCLGSSGFVESEGADRQDMQMPGRQNELVERVTKAARGPVTVVLNVGSPKELPWLDTVASVLLVHYGGEEMAGAVVDVLFGQTFPGGRLPYTWLRRFEDSPSFSSSSGRDFASVGQAEQEGTTLLGAPTSGPRTSAQPGETVYTDGLSVGYRGFMEGGPSAGTPVVFPFGHGLSYTSFEYDKVRAEVLSSCASCAPVLVTVKVTVRNTGTRAGSEVVQLYVEALPSAREQNPGPRALQAFRRTPVLGPGEEHRVEFQLGARALGRSYNVEVGAWQGPVAGERVRLDFGRAATSTRASTKTSRHAAELTLT